MVRPCVLTLVVRLVVLQTCSVGGDRSNLSQQFPYKQIIDIDTPCLLQDRIKWKVEYDYNYYKVYDGKGHLAGYFFPHYGQITPEDKEDEIVAKMNENRELVSEGTLLVPMAKLDLLDHEAGLNINDAIGSLEANLARTKMWRDWLQKNASQFSIFGASVYTAREDRNMLSIAMGIGKEMTLGEKEIKELLTPMLDRLHVDLLL